MNNVIITTKEGELNSIKDIMKLFFNSKKISKMNVCECKYKKDHKNEKNAS